MTTTDDTYTDSFRLCDDDGQVSNTQHGEGITYLTLHNRLAEAAGRPTVAEPFACTGSAHYGDTHVRCTSPAHTDGKSAWQTPSPTPPPFSTESGSGGPPSEVSSTEAREETREVSFLVPVPGFDGWEVECSMRLVRHPLPGQPELWSVSIPPQATTLTRTLPPSVLVSGRAKAEAACRALAVAYALHCSEARKSAVRYSMYVAHHLTEAGVEDTQDMVLT